MSVTRLPRLALGTAVLALAGGLLGSSPAVAAPEPPRVQTIVDARGDVSVVGAVPGAVARSVDVRRVVVSREANELRVRFAVADVRSFDGWLQRATVVLADGGEATQTFTTDGGELVKSSPQGERRCGRVVRRPAADVVSVTIPDSCVRVSAGRYPRLTPSFWIAPVDAVDPLATDSTRSVRAAPR